MQITLRDGKPLGCLSRDALSGNDFHHPPNYEISPRHTRDLTLASTTFPFIYTVTPSDNAKPPSSIPSPAVPATTRSLSQRYTELLATKIYDSVAHSTGIMKPRSIAGPAESQVPRNF